MGISYYISLVFYVQVPRSALPALMNNTEKSVFMNLMQNGLNVYPGKFGDYDDNDDDRPVYYTDGDVDHKDPRVNIRLIEDAWRDYDEKDTDHDEKDTDHDEKDTDHDEKDTDRDIRDGEHSKSGGDGIPKWALSGTFDRDYALLLDSRSLESYKFRDVADSGDDFKMRRELEEAGIDMSKVTTGWLVVGKCES